MIPGQRQVSIPGLVRIKPGVLDRVGVYLRRADYRRVALIHSEGLFRSCDQTLQLQMSNPRVMRLIG